jgi:hypothetical protein
MAIETFENKGFQEYERRFATRPQVNPGANPV